MKVEISTVSYRKDEKLGREIIDLNLKQATALNTDGENKSNRVRFYNFSVFNDTISNVIENSFIANELQALKDDYLSNELIRCVAALLANAVINITQIVVSKDENNKDLINKYVATEVNSIALHRDGVLSYYSQIAQIEQKDLFDGKTIEGVRKRTDFALNL